MVQLCSANPGFAALAARWGFAIAPPPAYRGSGTVLRILVVSRNGKPLVRITRLDVPKRRIQFGLLKGKLTIPGDFDAPLPDAALAGFEGRRCACR